ncbi:MAG: hypothetical protein HY303_06640 [Candidatus Wallbacteria bacterium]|nr:hypothetical protein [Candidatus Wallbacteria bacterium]
MRHARDAALDELEELLVEVRSWPGVKERTRGSFYRRSSGFRHFHEDPAGLFADLKGAEGWIRLRVSEKSERRALLQAARELLAGAGGGAPGRRVAARRT